MLNLPPPLGPEQAARLHDWERFLVRFYVSAILLLIALTGLGLAFDQSQWLRRGLLVLILGLLVAAAAIQWRVRCPRCERRLGFQSRLRFPDFCPHCRVPFPRPAAP